MESITRVAQNTQGASEYATVDVIPGDDWRFEAAVSRAALGRDYLTRAWLPRKGPAFVALIRVLRRHCYRDWETGEQRDWCYPEVETLARECGVSARTIYRLLRDPELGYFVYRQHRRRYSPAHHSQVRTSNLYIVRLDDPPVPEDEAHYVAVEATMRASWGQDTESATAAPSAPQAHADTVISPARPVGTTAAVSTPVPGSQNALPMWQSERSAKTADESDSLNLNLEEEFSRFGPADGERVERWNTHQEEERPGVPPETAEEDAEAFAQARHVAEYILRDFGDVRPAVGASGLVRALQRAEAPSEVWCELLRVARARVRRRQSRAGTDTVIRNQAAYFMRTAEQLAREAERVAWDVAGIGERDQAVAVGAAAS